MATKPVTYAPLSHKPSSWLNLWWWELLTWILGTLAIGAIFAVLIIFSDKAQDTWTSKLSMNAKWAWFGKKRELEDLKIMDDATRGSGGSLCFLLTLPLRWLKGVGLSFVQQAVRIEQRDVTDTAPAYINALTGFDLFDGFACASDGVENCAFDMTPTMESAIKNGFKGRDIRILSLAGQCPTSRCKWSSYRSLSFCPSVQDISNDVRGWMLKSSSYAQLPNGTNINLLPVGLFSAQTTNGYSPPGRDGRNVTLWFTTIAPPDGWHRSDRIVPNAPASLIFEVYMLYTSHIKFVSLHSSPVAAAKAQFPYAYERCKRGPPTVLPAHIYWGKTKFWTSGIQGTSDIAAR
ncbi:hypothetical protein EJ08DRAFT_732324 [Tothia fuscella]|uniref:Uncharacterized protein n=1 Tax=Tothia fuscella TaxID=1048955 RepID=A0A9P4U131_9PEZI|nr:hypothetical protein EJ08DRAFT_732324 [Tothia fuscella]